MISKIRLKIIAGRINKILEIYTIFARKMPDYIIRQRDETEARRRPNLGQGQNFGLNDLTSLPGRQN